MRLNYTILCIDDQISSLRNLKRAITQHNQAVGVQTDFLDLPVKQGPFESVEDLRKRIFSEISMQFENNHIDLIIVDLHLGNMQGHEVIGEIRQTQTIYRPIIFYSGGDPAGEENAKKQLHDGLVNNGLVGKSVFLSVRGQDLERDLKNICSEMHDEEHKLNASRGLLMDRTSEIDAIVLEYLRKNETWGFEDKESQQKIQKTVADEIKRQRKNALKKACRMRELARTGFAGFTKWICGSDEKEVVFGIDAFSRNSLMRELLRLHEDTKEAGQIHSTYFKPQKDRPHLTGIRDTYAHQTEKQIGDDHNTDKCKYIREEVRVHLKNITKVTSQK